MHAIEVADGRDGRAEVARDLVERAKDASVRVRILSYAIGAHVIAPSSSMGKLKPSYAIRIFSGSLAFVSSWPNSCAMCVSQVCFAPMRRDQSTACSTVAWLGCGLWRNADNTTW